MTEKTKYTLEVFLYTVLWAGETICRPSYRGLGETFEGWLCRHRLLERVHELEANRFMERYQGESKIGETIMRLTERGRLKALGGRDPAHQWKRAWDGRWRFAVFDVPERQRKARLRLRKFFKARRFGKLQGSLWISPDPIDSILEELSGKDPTGLIVLPNIRLERDAESRIVAKAWNFERINDDYDEYLDFLANDPPKAGSVSELIRWISKERRAWGRATSRDPFLPEALLPRKYAGSEAWRRKQKAMDRWKSFLPRLTKDMPTDFS